jgi:hypothetical protein
VADGFVGLYPSVGAIGGSTISGGSAASNSSLSALFSGQARSSASASLSATGSIAWSVPVTATGFSYVFPFIGVIEGVTPPTVASGAAVIASSASVEWKYGAITGVRNNISATLNVLWEGTQLKVPAAFSFNSTGGIGWLTDIGSVFLFADSQGTMNPTGASRVNSTVISASSGFIDWHPAQVPTDGAFSITATGAFTVSYSIIQNAGLNAPAVLSAVFNASQITPSEVFQSSALSGTWDGQQLVTQAPVRIIASAAVGWVSVPAILVDAEASILATSSLLPDTQELMPITQFSVISISRARFSSVAQVIPSQIDDEDYRRRTWNEAAQQERLEKDKLGARQKQDEDDLLVLSAALSAAYAEYRLH